LIRLEGLSGKLRGKNKIGLSNKHNKYYLWFFILKKALDNFFKAIQEKVEGTVKIKSYEGSCIIIGKESDKSLYWQELAIVDKDTLYNQSNAGVS